MAFALLRARGSLLQGSSPSPSGEGRGEEAIFVNDVILDVRQDVVAFFLAIVE